VAASYLARVYAAAAIPDDLIEAGRIDGAGEGRIFTTVALRIMSPALVTMFLFQFVAIWNNFFLPLVMLSNTRLYPVTLGLYTWNNEYGQAPQLVSYVIIGDAILSFQWRASATGAEKFHSGMLPHAGTESRVWREVVALGADLGRLAPVAGRPVPAEAAMLLDWESWWALEQDSHPSRLRLIELLRAFYRPLFEAGVTADFAHPESDLSKYRLVLVPALYLVSDAGADNVGRFVADGGTILMSFFSGIVDPTDRIRLGGYPAPWRDLLGLRVEEFAPLPEGALVRLDGASGTEDTGGVGCVWQDAIDLLGADPLLSYGDGHLVGRAAATSHPYGRGEAFYLGTLPDRATLRGLVERACRRAGVAFLTDVPPGVEAVRRGDYLFVISHLDHPVDLDVGGKSLDLLTADIVGPSVALGPRDVLVLTARD
jgi:beta-galactosidase